MSVRMRATRRSEHHTNAWSGGETTELAIFPPNSQYATRDFGWRLSSATVLAETSEFTRLPGYNRILLLLTGELRLQSAGGQGTILHPGEQHAFRGDTPITSHGLATDFNLILGPGWDGSLVHAGLAPSERRIWRPADTTRDTTRHALVYCWQGQVLATPAHGPAHSLGAGDLLWATLDTGCSAMFDIVNESNGQSTLVFVTVADKGDQPAS